MKKLIVLLAVLGVALGACGKAKTFTATDLGAIILGQTEAPTGLTYIAQGSGPQTVDQFASDAAEKTKLVSYNFKGANQSVFANQSAIGALTGSSTTLPQDAELVASVAAIFKTADDAKKALALEHANDVAKGTNITSFSTPKLGDETFAEHGVQRDDPFPSYLISWRLGNAIFAVIVSGGGQANATASVAQSLAKTINDRAEKA